MNKGEVIVQFADGSTKQFGSANMASILLDCPKIRSLVNTGITLKRSKHPTNIGLKIYYKHTEEVIDESKKN